MSEEEGIDRRTLIRLLIVMAIGVPILIEAVTFFGLLSHSVTGEDATETATPIEDAVGVGEEVLPATPQSERITTASIGTAGEGWQFVLTVQVTNEGTDPYEFRLGTVRTTGETVVAGTATTGRIQPEDSTTVTESWSLPEGERPRTVDVSSISYRTDGPERTNVSVRLKPVPVQGG